MPRVRNWKDLNFYRPAPHSRYRHIDALFGEPARNVIDWDLIETYYADVMRVVLSVQEGKISSATLLRRLSTYSRRNNIYQAFREIGRVIRTIQLLRFLSDAQLRRRTTAETNKVESYNRFSSWCRFGNAGVIAANDPDEQEKILKFSTLLTNAVIFHTTVDMMSVIRDLAAEGWHIIPEDLAGPSPYVTARIQRFGVYATDEIALTPNRSTPTSASTSPPHPDPAALAKSASRTRGCTPYSPGSVRLDIDNSKKRGANRGWADRLWGSGGSGRTETDRIDSGRYDPDHVLSRQL